MATNTIIAGIASFTVDGVYYDVVSDAEYDASSVKQTMLVGQSGVQGASIMPVPGFISAKLRDASSLTQASFSSMNGVTVQLKSISGKNIVGTLMNCTEISSINTQTGEFTAKFEGVVVEITA